MKIPKRAVLYLHVIGTDYTCAECPWWLSSEQCVLHGRGVRISATGSCGFWVPSEELTSSERSKLGRAPLGLVTQYQSGYEDSVDGFSCKRCDAFVPGGNCRVVDRLSEGDDPGRIDPDACCSAWTARR